MQPRILFVLGSVMVGTTALTGLFEIYAQGVPFTTVWAAAGPGRCSQIAVGTFIRNDNLLSES